MNHPIAPTIGTKATRYHKGLGSIRTSAAGDRRIIKIAAIDTTRLSATKIIDGLGILSSHPG
jgi:hypothetical protein